MKLAYPVIISKGDKYLIASAPDLEVDTQGENLADAIDMARDAISIWCVCEQDAGREIPLPSDISEIEHESTDILTLVDVDIDAYRRAIDQRAVRKNLTIPSWLNERAERANINFSAVLQEALKERLTDNL